MKILNGFKKVAKFSILGLGVLSVFGGIVGSSFALQNEHVIKNYISEVATDAKKSIRDINLQLKDTKNNATSTTDYVKNVVDRIVNLVNTKTDEIKNIIVEVKKIPKTEIISSQMDSIINNLDSLRTETIPGIKQQVNDGTKQVEDFLESENIKNAEKLMDDVQKTLDDVNNYINDPNNQIWFIYNSVFTVVLTICSSILAALVVGYILRFVWYKKVDGIWVRRTKVTRDTVKHVQKILKKYPELYDIIEEELEVKRLDYNDWK